MYLMVITGPMFAGKTTELLDYARRFETSDPLIVKPTLDSRAVGLGTHDGRQYPAHMVQNVDDLTVLYIQYASHRLSHPLILIDDAQFLRDLDRWVSHFRPTDVELVIAGLDLDYMGQPWEHMAALLAEADEVTKLEAVCAVCGEPARMTQRLLGGQPAPPGPRVLVGGAGSYEPRCRQHWVSPWQVEEVGPRV